MYILPHVRIIDLGLYLEKHHVLIFSDFHMGYEDALIAKGVLVPRFALKDIIKRLEKIFSQVPDVKTVVINGDLKHEFGRISKQEWSDTFKLIEYLLTKVRTVHIIKGNHDPMLGPITAKQGIYLVPSLILNDILIIHGDQAPKIIASSIKMIIIGHEHPAIRLRSGYRNELFKCFLLGRYKNKNLIVCPSFHLLHEGSDVLGMHHLSPFFECNIMDAKAWIVADKVYSFGCIRDLPRNIYI